MEESQFTSPFWHYYIVVIVVLSFIFIIWLLLSQNAAVKRTNDEVKTMGHSWDGIEEYNNPLPRWWFLMFVALILVSIGYLFFYPGMGDYKGQLGWSSTGSYQMQMDKANKEIAKLYGKYTAMKVEDVAKDPAAMAMGQNLFDTYCIQCHGSDAKGQRGFPNLTDTDWLWGGTPDKIHETIANGRLGVMPQWGPVLGEESVKDVANFVMSLSGKEHNEDRAARGKEIFAANCATCHGDKGQGNQGTAPNLTDDTWLWGGSEKAITETIIGGHKNQMPAWKNFLTDDKIHLLTAYVWGKSHPNGVALPTDTKNAIGGKIPNAVASEPAVSTTTAAASIPEKTDVKQAVETKVMASETASAAVKATDAQSKAMDKVSASDVVASEPVADKAVVTVEDGVVKFYFATGKSAIAPDADKAAEEVVAAAKSGKKLILSGFTDSTGNAAANARLSLRRAEAVRAFLKKQGVNPALIELRKPQSSVGGKGNNAEGRRVEVKIEG